MTWARLGRSVALSALVGAGLGVVLASTSDRGSCGILGGNPDPLPGCLSPVVCDPVGCSFQSGTVAGTTSALRSWPRVLSAGELREVGAGVLIAHRLTFGDGDRAECRMSRDRGPVACSVVWGGGVVSRVVVRVWEDGSVRTIEEAVRWFSS